MNDSDIVNKSRDPIETLLKQDKERDCEETSEPTERKNVW